jgi:hypothetical protein
LVHNCGNATISNYSPIHIIKSVYNQCDILQNNIVIPIDNNCDKKSVGENPIGSMISYMNVDDRFKSGVYN